MKIFGIEIFAHRRRKSINSISDARDLIERFMLDRPAYDFEWDDFISWKNENELIENVRIRLECIEPLLSSGNPLDKEKAFFALKKEILYLDSLKR